MLENGEESQACLFDPISQGGKLRIWEQRDLGKGEAERERGNLRGAPGLGGRFGASPGLTRADTDTILLSLIFSRISVLSEGRGSPLTVDNRPDPASRGLFTQQPGEQGTSSLLQKGKQRRREICRLMRSRGGVSNPECLRLQTLLLGWRSAWGGGGIIKCPRQNVLFSTPRQMEAGRKPRVCLEFRF